MDCEFTLFSQAELQRFSSNIDIHSDDIAIVKEWCQSIDDEGLKGEMRNYLDFYDRIIKGLLGYETTDREFEKKTKGGKRVEFCIVDEHKMPILIFELKGQKTQLDKSPAGKRFSPVEQAHQYAYQLGGTWYVVSNYVEFWVFNYHKPQRCHKFNFRDLVDEAGEVREERLREFKFLLSKDQVLNLKSLNVLNSRTEVYEREFTNNFYKLYHETRLMLLEEFQTNNGLSKEHALQYAQIVLNRVLFLLFAEDDTRELLKRHTLENEILNPILNAEVRHAQHRIWQNLLNMFNDINSGNQFRDIPAYDGELFQEDLTHLSVRDLLHDPDIYQKVRTDHGHQLDLGEKGFFVQIFGKKVIRALGTYRKELNPIYLNLLIMGSFDFSTEITEDILGHIFELSLTDLEEFTNVEESRKNTSRRHADGIFYTPEFVTEYIVRKSLLYYLRMNPDTQTFDQLIEENVENLDAFETRIRNLKILDPACGSGAFLVKAVDLLTELYRKIHHLRIAKGVYIGKKKRKLEVTPTTLDRYFDAIEVHRKIVLDSIYGVDKNAESVAITKLALFLKIAKKDLEFPDLADHIKTGDSLVTDSQVTPNAFAWREEFPEIFETGGFDIVVGNPPWGADLTQYRDYLENEYAPIARGQFDSFAIFLYNNLRDVLKSEGVLGYIIPNELCLEDVNEPLRRALLQKSVVELINLGFDIFENVTKPSLITLIHNSPSLAGDIQIVVGLSKQVKQMLKNRELGIDTIHKRSGYQRRQESFVGNPKARFDIWTTSEDRKILDVIDATDFSNFRTYVTNGRGIDTNRQGKYFVCPNCTFLNSPFGVGKAGKIKAKTCENEGCDFTFQRNLEETYQLEFIFSDEVFGTVEEFDTPGYIGSDLYKFHFSRKPRAFKYFGDKIKDPEYQRYSKILWKDPALYQGEKLLIRKVSTGNLPEVMIHEGFLVFNQQLYCFQKRDPAFPVSLKFYLAVLGSRLFHYYYIKRFGDPDKETLPHFTQTKILQIPVPHPNIESQQYKEVLSHIEAILNQVEVFKGLEQKSFETYLHGYPRVGTESLRDIANRLDPSDRVFPPVKMPSTGQPIFEFCEIGEWLEINLKFPEGRMMVMRLRIEDTYKRRFLLEFLMVATIPKHRSMQERFLGVRIPVFSSSPLENEAIIRELVDHFATNEKQKQQVLERIENKFSLMDDLILEYYNVPKGEYRELIRISANKHGFRVF